MMKKFVFALFFLCLTCIVFTAFADTTAIRFSYKQERINSNEMLLSIRATTAKNISLYGLQSANNNALYSTVQFDSSVQRLLIDSVMEKGTAHTEKDATVDAQVRFFFDSVLWQQEVKALPSDSAVLKGMVTYLYKKGDQYIPGEEKFTFYIHPVSITANTVQTATNSVENKTLLWIFFTAFAGGLLALFTPCVYSMIPVTVSFFTKRSKTRSEGIRNALYYAISIVLIFTLLGFLITLIFGPAALNNLSTNWIANLIFFALFLVFGISFLGAFDINLPTNWSTKADSKAGLKSFSGIFFMALTLVAVSFSCTGPIIGNLLVLAAKGNYYGPLVGMFGFSVALALPFALFAFFPSKLNVLGKAGGWLNAVKVTLGFLELALALKFLSNADLSKSWRLLDREVFLSLWIVIFALLGLYLLGKIKFHHDDDLPNNDFGLPYLTIPRLLFAIAAFSFVVYMIPGLWGAPLKGISAFVPPLGTQDFISSSGAVSAHFSDENKTTAHPTKYYEVMKKYEPEVVVKYGMTTYFDYDEALAVARAAHKPLMLDFTGINCVNCRKMEGQVWSDPQVMQMLKDNFIIVSLYVDVQNLDLPQNEQYFSKALNKQVETLGDKNADFQVTKFGANSQPFYFFLDGNEKRLAEEGYGYNPDINKFLTHLRTVIQAFENRK